MWEGGWFLLGVSFCALAPLGCVWNAQSHRNLYSWDPTSRPCKGRWQTPEPRGFCGILLHPFETIGNHCVLAFTGESPIRRFLGGAKRISSIHSMLKVAHVNCTLERLPSSTIPSFIPFRFIARSWGAFPWLQTQSRETKRNPLKNRPDLRKATNQLGNARETNPNPLKETSKKQMQCKPTERNQIQKNKIQTNRTFRLRQDHQAAEAVGLQTIGAHGLQDLLRARTTSGHISSTCIYIYIYGQ